MNSKNNWDLTQIFKDEKDFNKNKDELYEIFDEIQKFQGCLCNSAESLYKCYSLYEKADEIFEKLYAYGMLTYHLDMANQESIKLFKQVENISTDFSIAVSYITPEIIAANEEDVRSFLNNEPNLSKYKRDIEEILDKKKHILSKQEENLLSNYSEIFANSENTYDIFTNAELKYGNIINEEGKEVELTDATYTNFLKSSDVNVRKQAFDLMYDSYKKYINTITELYLSRVKCVAITSKIRNYSSSLEKAVIHDDATIKVYNSLISTIDNMLDVNYEFMNLKKSLLKLDKMHMYDIYFNPLEQKKEKITFDDAKAEVIKALSILGDEYVGLLNEAFDNKWIDVYAKDNKRGGAYSLGVYGVHPFVLTNFIGDKRDVSTIAHELSHAIHSYYSNKEQNIIDANYTIMVAEVASTVNEILLSSYQIENEKDKYKKASLIYEMVENIRATLFRQAMFAEFEKIVHEKIESGTMLSAEDLNEIYLDLNKKYFGENVEVDDKIKYEWARIPHFYSCFYVYKYATGISSAIAIASKILNKEPGYVEKYKEMLKQGRTKKSVELLKMVDVDLESKKPYEDAINFYKKNIEELKEILK